MIDFVRRRSYRFAVAAAVLGVFGMMGYVGGRIIADYELVPLVFASTYVVLAGLALFATVVFMNAPGMSKPAVGWAMGTLFVLYGILLVAFPYDRSVFVPMTALLIALIFLVFAAWKDMRKICGRASAYNRDL